MINSSTTVIEIPLTQGCITTIDACDADLIDVKWLAMRSRKTFYAARMINHQPIYLHLVILERIVGRALLTGEMGDHIDLNPMNNKRNNLRPASVLQNNRNVGLKANNTSGYKGVNWSKKSNKWEAKITVNYKTIHVGYFDDKQEAYLSYCAAALKYHGEFANFGDAHISVLEAILQPPMIKEAQ